MTSIADDTRWLDATAQAELVADRAVTASELVEAAIERIEADDGPLNSVVVRWFDDARDLAERGAIGNGRFRGVPGLLKDLNAHSAGQVMTNGNVAMRNEQFVSSFDSNITARLRDAGSIMLGRSSSPELGSVPVTEPLAYGPARNPWNLDHTPGGSSGGAAAAVAAGMVAIGHASDGGGSIRIPASCCGLVGLKPSQGRISMGPDRSESGLAVDFVVTRSVRDMAGLLDEVSGPGVGDNVVAPTPIRPFNEELGVDPGALRIGVLDHRPDGTPIHPECAAAATSAATTLTGLGHEVQHAFPESLADESFGRRFMSLWTVSRAAGIANYERMIGRPLADNEIEPVNAVMASMASRSSAGDYADALAAVAEFRRQTLQWWADGWDLLVTPTLAEPPARIGEFDAPTDDPLQPMRRAAAFSPFTPPFNATGQPAVSLPLHWSPDGLPIGVQLVAAYGREDLLIRVASQLEDAQPWSGRRPPR